jgi:hypothetical protein
MGGMTDALFTPSGGGGGALPSVLMDEIAGVAF